VRAEELEGKLNRGDLLSCCDTTCSDWKCSAQFSRRRAFPWVSWRTRGAAIGRDSTNDRREQEQGDITGLIRVGMAWSLVKEREWLAKFKFKGRVECERDCSLEPYGCAQGFSETVYDRKFWVVSSTSAVSKKSI